MSGKRSKKLRRDARKTHGHMSERELRAQERFLKSAHKRGQKVVLS